MNKIYTRVDDAYRDLIREILDHGEDRTDRTGTGTRSIFGAMMKLDCRDGSMPVVSLKKTLWRTSIKEILWMMSGSDNIQPLVAQGVTIWTDWALKRYRAETGDQISRKDFEQRLLADAGFSQIWGYTGRSYGAQYRDFRGADGRSVDQVAAVLKLLRDRSDSRRIIFTAWNPPEIDEMARYSLPPCVHTYQYSVRGDELHAISFARSTDCGLGLSYNIGASAYLMNLFALLSGLKPGVLTFMMADAHLYSNHIDAMAEVIENPSCDNPQLEWVKRPETLDQAHDSQVNLVGYAPRDFRPLAVAV